MWILLHSLVLQYDVRQPDALRGDPHLRGDVPVQSWPGRLVPSEPVVTPLLHTEILRVWFLWICLIIAKKIQQTRRLRLPFLSRRSSSGPPPFHSEERRFSKQCQLSALTRQKQHSGLDSPERWGWWESSWCGPEWCHRSSPSAGHSCCSLSSNL